MIIVVGAGPVGIYISELLLNKGYNVLLVEAGNEISESSSLSLDDYKFVTRSAIPRNVHRVGGGSNYWHSRFGEFLSEDFISMDSIGVQGWPIDKVSLSDYYKQASRDISGEYLSDNEYIEMNFLRQKEYVNPVLDLRVFRFTNKDIFLQKLQTIKDNPKFELRLNSKVVKITPSHESSKKICHIEKNDESYAIDSEIVIIACGTLQSTKLILESPNLVTDSIHDFIGKGLIEHLEGFIGLLRVPQSKGIDSKLFELSRTNRVMNLNAGIGLRLNSTLHAQKQLPSLHIELRPRPRHIKSKQFSLRGKVRNPLYPLERAFKKIIETIFEVTDQILKRKTYGIWVKSEEFKTQKSTLSIDRDHSKSYLVYNHQVSEITYSKFFETLELLIPEVSKLFNAKASLYPWVKNNERNAGIEVNWHPMGTLPMGADKTKSICDLNLECHELRNVFIISPAVFNRGSNGNPTFTSLALCCRLVNEILGSRKL